MSLPGCFGSCVFSCRFFGGCFSNHPFREFLGSGFAVPLLVGLVRNLSFDEQLREFAPLSFALERHLENPRLVS